MCLPRLANCERKGSQCHSLLRSSATWSGLSLPQTPDNKRVWGSLGMHLVLAGRAKSSNDAAVNKDGIEKLAC
eukprot:scaffold348_cov329-Pavlova_lutheri.AAC.26